MAQKLFVLFHLTIISLVNIINGFSIDMIPIDSPELKMLPQSLTERERHQHLAKISLSRAYKISKKQLSLSPDGFGAPLEEVYDNYFVTSFKIGQGKGALTPYLLLDTGVDKTWVQCKGCGPCIVSRLEDFDYSNSTTYKKMGKGDTPLCPLDHFYKGMCGFDEVYTNNSRAVGFLGRDTFSFKNSKTQIVEVYHDLAFGCGIENTGFHFGANTGKSNAITGIHGLAPGPSSFLNQLDNQIKGRFSYCIPSWTEQDFSKSTMYFGDDAQISGDAIREVKVLSMETEGRYYLRLNGISVDGDKLQIDPVIFKRDPKTRDKGFIIDSGTPYTVLTERAYVPLRTAIVKFFMDKYQWIPDRKFKPPFDVCYKGKYPEDSEYGFPRVVFLFANEELGTEVAMDLSKEHMFLKITGRGFCMMMLKADNSSASILGAFQQANFNILYDVSNSLLHFVPQRCSEGPQ